MESVTVRSLMSSPVISIPKTMRLPQIKNLMRDNNIRRLPVLDDDRVVGIVTYGDIRNAFPSDATTLSIYELSYLIGQVSAADIMRRAVITVDADTSVVDVARLMLTQKISGLPVVDNGKLVGMITESDIFRAVISGQLVLTTTVAIPARQPQSRINI